MIIYIDCDMVFKKFERIALLTDAAVAKWNNFIDRVHSNAHSDFKMVINGTETCGPTITFPHIQTKKRKQYVVSDNHKISKFISVTRKIGDTNIAILNIETNKRLYIHKKDHITCPVVFTSVHPDISKIMLNGGHLEQYHDTYCSQKDRANSFMHPFLQLLFHIGIHMREIALVIKTNYGSIAFTLADLLCDMATIETDLNKEFETIRSFFNFIHARYMQQLLSGPNHGSNEFNLTGFKHGANVSIPIPDLQLVKNDLPYYYKYSFVTDNAIKQAINVLYSGKYIAHMIIRGTSILEIIMPEKRINAFKISYPIVGSPNIVMRRPTIRLVTDEFATITDYGQNTILSWLFAIGCKSENIRLRYNL